MATTKTPSQPPKATPPLPEDLQQLLADIQMNPDGIKEFDLLQLRFSRLDADARPNLAEPAVLFRQHFLLFHQLYRLDEYLVLLSLGRLDIHTLAIRWQPCPMGAASQQLQRQDPLRDYYLDLDNLSQTTEQDVDDMLAQFWQRYSGIGRSGADLSAEFDLFGLPPEADYNSVKARFRVLISKHHPDKGGDQTQCQRILAAMEVFNRYFKA